MQISNIHKREKDQYFISNIATTLKRVVLKYKSGDYEFSARMREMIIRNSHYCAISFLT